jgi:hypothetical protein
LLLLLLLLLLLGLLGGCRAAPCCGLALFATLGLLIVVSRSRCCLFQQWLLIGLLLGRWLWLGRWLGLIDGLCCIVRAWRQGGLCCGAGCTLLALGCPLLGLRRLLQGPEGQSNLNA